MEKNKKKGASCWVEKFGKKETVRGKLHRWIKNIKYIYQRARYGYCDIDIWSIDQWFLEIMPSMLQQLKDTTDSYPCASDFPSQAVNGTRTPEEIDNEGMQNWQNILSEMIFLFNEANEDTCTKKNKYDIALDKYRDECKDRAFELFSKWFRYLWD